MGTDSKIEWTTHTFNPWIGCQKVSPGCDRCYAEAMMDHRYHRVQWGPHGERKRTTPDYRRQPQRWNAGADRFEREYGHRQRVFCASLADVFDNAVSPEWRHDLWDRIKQTPRLDWMILSKRPQNILRMLPTDWGDGWRHVWLGVTCESQGEYDRRWPLLACIPTTVRFISYEPALTPLQLDAWQGVLPDWVICGGESGAGARTMDSAWARLVRDQCADTGISFFMKQMTGKRPIPPDLMVRQFPKRRP
jgi:protein gp37